MIRKLINIAKNNYFLSPLYRFARKLYLVYLVEMSRLRLRIYGLGMLRDVHKAFLERGVRYFVDYGTLLGVVREKHFIRHDNDIDISVFADSVTAVELIDIMKSKGFLFFRALEYNGVITEIVFCRSKVHFDVFFQFCEGDRQWGQGAITEIEVVNGVSKSVKKGKRRYRSRVNECKEVPFMGIGVMMPNNYDELLSQSYGNDWMTPKIDYITTSDDATRQYIRIVPGVVHQVDEKSIRMMFSQHEL